MLNGKFMITLITMIVMIAALFGSELKQGYIENYSPITSATSSRCAKTAQFGPWAGSQQTSNVGGTAIAQGGRPICVANTKLGFQTSECGQTEFPRGVSTNRSIQPLISPRGPGGVTATPSIRYMKPSTSVMAYDPARPHQGTKIEDMAHMVGSVEEPASIKTIKESYVDYENAQVPLPKDMCNVNLMGEESQPVIYDRLMYSNMRSRLRGQGDYIRGDLKVTPDSYKAGAGSHNNWFQVSVKPERDLNPGCMDHLFGRSEELSLGMAQGDLCVPTYGL